MGCAGHGSRCSGKRLASVVGDELYSLIKPDIGAAPPELARFTAHEVGVVEIAVPPEFGGLRNPSAAVHDRTLEPAIVRTVRVRIAQMPLPKYPRRVAGLGERVGERPFVLAQERSPANCVLHPSKVRVVADQQPGTRSTERASKHAAGG